MAFAHTLQGTEQHLHRGHSHWAQGAWLSRAEGGQGATLCPCRCVLSAQAVSQLSRVGKEGPWAAEVARAMMAALRPGQPPGRAPILHLEGHFPRTMLYCSRGSFLHPLSPSSDLAFSWLLSPSSPEPLLWFWSCPHSCPVLICLATPPPDSPQESCCLPTPHCLHCPAALQELHAHCCLNIWKPAHLILGLCLSKAERVFSL